MDTAIIIKCILAILSATYTIGLITVCVYELKKKSLYHDLLEELVSLENFQLSMAVAHARTYRIMEDYRRNSAGLERVQQFILKNLLFIGKRNRQERISMA